ncbi:hypothetical protein G6F56_012573 [Rhizopus delemar]|nr:hypothetical protein G6F56_012573 [Rhizopus delemar]
MDQMTEEIGELSKIVRNLNKNNVTNETIEVEQAIQLPALNEPIRQDINLVKSTPNSTHLYGKEEHRRIMAFVAETMGLLYNENDTEQNNDFRIESIKQKMKRLNDIARVSVGLIYELVQADQSLDQCKMF